MANKIILSGENSEETIIRMKKEGKTFDEICDYIARQIGYDDTVSYYDIVSLVEKVLNDR